MSKCKACGVGVGQESDLVVEICQGCTPKKLSCRVCDQEFTYQDILHELPIVRCPSCQGHSVDELD